MSRRTRVALWCAVLLLFVLEFKKVYDTDIFWQVKLGQMMLAEGRLPVHDRFTYTHSGEPVPPIGWLAQGLYAPLYDLGGWHLVRAVHHLTLVGSLLLAAATCRRNVTSPLSLAVALFVAFLVILSNADLRPQGLALCCFAGLLALARSRLHSWVKLVLAIPLLLAWQNMHPSVAVGVVALGGLTVADLWGKHHDDQPRWEMGALALLATAAQCATPLGAGLFGVSAANLRIGRDVLHVGEWLPPWDPINRTTMVPFWMALAGSLVVLVWRWDRFSLRDRWLFVVMTLLALYATRFGIFWAVALVPLWAEMVEQLVPGDVFVWARGSGQERVQARRALSVLAVAVVLVFAVHPARFRPIIRPEIPLDGVHALRAVLPSSARIYNDYVWAGPLLLDGAPGWRLAVDGRLYFFRDPAEWCALEDARAGRITLDELERRHRPDAFFLNRCGDLTLVESLSRCRRWRVGYSSASCVAFVRAR